MPRILITFLFVSVSAHAAEISEIDRLFTLKIQPLLSEKCNGCHGDDPEDIKGGYDMLTREKLLAGGEEYGEEVLVLGDASKSFFVDTIKWVDPEFEMPPKENDRLNEEQIAMIEKWINAGAPWPGDDLQAAIRDEEKKRLVTEDGVLVATSGGLGDEWTYRRYQPEDIWAFQPVVKPEIRNSKSENPVDHFVWSKLNEAGFEPAARADARTLIRRATYDLIGLPPTPKEVFDFLQAFELNPDQAWEALIDRLLASKHYGERWAQHWLDVARYADTGGFSNDYERSNMWRYRDWVIRSLNKDKPYNEFIIEQVAGDELADQSLRRRIKDWDEYQKARAERRSLQ